VLVRHYGIEQEQRSDAGERGPHAGHVEHVAFHHGDVRRHLRFVRIGRQHAQVDAPLGCEFGDDSRPDLAGATK
jgi:hypothetical protein